MCGTLSKAEERGATNISSSSSTASSSSSASNLTPGGGLSSSSSPASRLQQFGVGSSSGRMPASSSDDPVSNALHMSLLANKCSTLKCNSNGSDAGEGGSGGASLDNKLVASTKRVLLTEIAFEKCNSYTSTVLDTLKSRYIVLNTNDASAAASSNGGGGKVSEQVKKTKVVSEGGAKVSGEDGLPKPKIVLWSADSVQLGWQGSAPVGAGMVNLRNTCYLNSTLQALFHVPSFVNWLLNDKTHVSKCQLLNGLTHSECLICAMKSVLIAHRSTNNAIKPLQIYSKLKLICKHFVHGQQEDAHEFLRYLIESMERSYLNVVGGLKLDSYSKETTPLNQIFGGYLRTEVTCLVCGHVSTTFQHFEDLPLDIRQVSSVEAALDTYFSREQLGAAGGGDEAYKCDKCHRRVNATKKFSLQRAPNVLCLQLKRFGITGGKMSKHISLQMSLDMTRYMHASSRGGGAGGGQQQKGGRSYRYRLVSMISHIGPWSGCGHYTAMAAASNGHFYLFDDNLVRQMSVSNVLYNSNAYVMIYELEPSSAASSTSSCSSSSSLSSSSSSTASSSSSSSSPSSSSTLQQQQRSLSSPASNSSTTSASNGGNSTSKLVQNGGSSSSSSNGEASNGKSSSYFGASSASGGSSRVYGPLPPPRISDNSNSCTPSGRVYPTPATSPPPPRIATPSPHKQDNSSRASSSTTTSSSSTSSTTAYSMASSSSSSSSSCPSNSSSSPMKQQNNSCKKLNGTKQQRLVPYTTTESDDSSTEEGEEERTTLVAKRSQKFARPDCLMKKLEIDCASTASSTWHVTEVSSQQNQQHSASSISSVSSSSSSVGNWSVTESGNKVARTAGDSSSREAALPIGQLTEQHVVSGGSKWNQNGGGSEQQQQRKTGGKMWDGSRGGEGDATVNGLLKMSHRGYGGNSGVTTWEGGRSELDQELDKDKSNEQRKQLKRNYSSYHNNSYDDDLDRGKVKKVKYNNNSNGNNGQRYNPFQEHQNRKMGGGNNNWYGGGKRFYHNNSNGFRNNNRNNNNNGSSYHRNNGFNRWRH